MLLYCFGYANVEFLAWMVKLPNDLAAHAFAFAPSLAAPATWSRRLGSRTDICS